MGQDKTRQNFWGGRDVKKMRQGKLEPPTEDEQSPQPLGSDSNGSILGPGRTHSHLSISIHSHHHFHYHHPNFKKIYITINHNQLKWHLAASAHLLAWKKHCLWWNNYSKIHCPVQNKSNSNSSLFCFCVQNIQILVKKESHFFGLPKERFTEF